MLHHTGAIRAVFNALYVQSSVLYVEAVLNASANGKKFRVHVGNFASYDGNKNFMEIEGKGRADVCVCVCV